MKSLLGWINNNVENRQQRKMTWTESHKITIFWQQCDCKVTTANFSEHLKKETCTEKVSNKFSTPLQLKVQKYNLYFMEFHHLQYKSVISWVCKSETRCFNKKQTNKKQQKNKNTEVTFPSQLSFALLKVTEMPLCTRPPWSNKNLNFSFGTDGISHTETTRQVSETTAPVLCPWRLEKWMGRTESRRWEPSEREHSVLTCQLSLMDVGSVEEIWLAGSISEHLAGPRAAGREQTH